MGLRNALTGALALLLAACASGKDAAKAEDDPFYAMPFGPAAARDTSDDFAGEGQVEAFTIEVVFQRADGSRLAAPRLTTFPGQTGNISMTTPVTCVVDYAPDMRDLHASPTAVTTTIDDGVRVELCATRAADGGVTLGYGLRLAKLKRPIDEFQSTLVIGPRAVIQLPQVTEVEAAGTRWIEPGVQGLLARVPSPDGSGPMLVLVRVAPVSVDAPPPGAASLSPEAGPLARPMSGPTRHLRVSAAQVLRDLEPGAVFDETSAPDVMDSADGRVLRDFELFSCLDSRLRLAGLLDGHGAVLGLVAEGRDDGRLDLEWTTSAGKRSATVRPATGRRFVALAHVDGGGTAGVVVSLDAD